MTQHLQIKVDFRYISVDRNDQMSVVSFKWLRHYFID